MNILRLRQAVAKLAKAEGTRDRNRALAELNHLIDEIERAPVKRAAFSARAVALLLGCAAPSNYFKSKRKFHVKRFADFDELVELVKAENPDYQDINL